MHRKIFGMLALAFAAAPLVAQAQTYNLDIDMTGIGDFAGSFNFDAGGNCFGATPFCGAGTTPNLTNISVTDAFGGGVFTGATAYSQNVAGGRVNLVDFEGLPPSTSSSIIFQLGFDIAAPLGGPATNIGISNVVLNIDSNVTGLFYCGTSPTGFGGRSCPTVSLTKAPEIDPASTASGLTLLLGSLLVLRGRRTA